MQQIIDSQKPGPNVVIMAGVHGNEPCGLQAFADFIPTLTLRKGKVTFVIGNPKAVAVHAREFEANLNRMFRPDETLLESEKVTYEYKRSRELMALLNDADALLDIHSSSTENTQPFVICEPQSFECAKFLPADVVVCGIDELHPTGTDAYVNQIGGLGICIECGNHNDSKAASVATAAIQSFLGYFNMIDYKPSVRNDQRHIQATTIYKNKGDFTLARSFDEFEPVQEGELIGRDDETAVRAQADRVILFPHNRSTPNQEAFIFGKPL